MQWWEIYVQVPESLSEVVSEYLSQLGSSAVVVYDEAVLRPREEVCVVTTPEAGGWTVLQGALPADEHLDAQVKALQLFLRQLTRRTVSPPLKFHRRLLRNTDYLTQWRHFFSPLTIGQRLVIRPPWETGSLPPGVACLVLEPGLAFGTGTHPTTHLCLQLLTHHPATTQGARVLDVGCGSGILSLAALQLGAREAVGVDIDAQAVAVAQRNAALNDLQHCAHFAHGSWDVTDGSFDIITANIYLGPLLEMSQPLAHQLAPAGLLIVSGILETQEEAVLKALVAARLHRRQRLAADGWVALVAEHAGVQEAK